MVPPVSIPAINATRCTATAWPSKGCMSFRCDPLDVAIAKEVLQALQPAELELALAALEELEARDHTIGRQWQMRLERAEYEAALAERRYQKVDPSQRLVTATLERRWNTALLHCEELKQQAAEPRLGVQGSVTGDRRQWIHNCTSI
jgi:hypothetical protein